MSFCKNCTSGVRHEGTPEGTYEKINGIKTYVATPKTDYPKDKAILYLTDVFGLELNNNRLVIDDFARNGFKVYAPDLFEGDAVNETAFDPGSDFDLYKWLPNHTAEHTGKRVRAVIEELKSKGITVFGATGYCYGARLVFDLAFENIIRVAVITHPSLLTTEDLDIYVKKSKAPLLLNSCEHDELFPPALALTTDEKFSNFEPGYKRTYWEGVHHGFATRGDLKNPVVTAAKEGAFKAIVEWFINHMQ
ncbi:chlorocatechol-degradation protein [Lactarius akahatsu]|uniref:Chlorocatechol-degradation protein n=1 Tax=Lactarius akahatsu TaxID=416441 RepID=A0AAD4LQ15_9AGAM|nr:chlorocatechol-degradation protein [Lactarius akahatsu]